MQMIFVWWILVHLDFKNHFIFRFGLDNDIIYNSNKSMYYDFQATQLFL